MRSAWLVTARANLDEGGETLRIVVIGELEEVSAAVKKNLARRNFEPLRINRIEFIASEVVVIEDAKGDR